MENHLEFNPPINERDDLELIAIAFSTTDDWQQTAIDQAKKELANRGISEEFQLNVVRKWEEAEKLEEIKHQEQLKKNATEKYDFAEMLYVLILSPLILTGKINSTSRLTLTELYKENYKIKFIQRIVLLILGIGLWVGSFYLLGFFITRFAVR
jgi:hypothetical protein